MYYPVLCICSFAIVMATINIPIIGAFVTTTSSLGLVHACLQFYVDISSMLLVAGFVPNLL